MNFLRFPMFQRGESNPLPPGAKPPLPETGRVYHSDSPDGPWEELPANTSLAKRYVLYAFDSPSQPRPALLWQQMQKAFEAAHIDCSRNGYSAEIEAVAEWLELNGTSPTLGNSCIPDRDEHIRWEERKRLCNLLKEQARLAREGNA